MLCDAHNKATSYLTACQCPESSEYMEITGCSAKNPVGQIITISCNKYRGSTVFDLVGSSLRTCTSSGNWSGNATMCIKSESSELTRLQHRVSNGSR